MSTGSGVKGQMSGIGKPKPPTELEEQAAVVQYLELLKAQGKVVVFSAVPNNLFTRSWGIKMKQVKEGVRKGVPDLIVVTKKNILFIEMKRTKGGVLGLEQKVWQEAIIATGGKAVVCKGAAVAIDHLNEIIKGESK